MNKEKNEVFKKACATILTITALIGGFFASTKYFVTADTFEFYKKENIKALSGMQQAQKFANYEFYVDSLERDEEDCVRQLKREPQNKDLEADCADLEEKRKTAEHKRDNLRDQLLGE